MQTFHTVDDLVDHLRSLGALTSSESIPTAGGDLAPRPAFSELDHGLQCAALLAAERGDDDELIVAGLVHDLAHPWDGPGQPNHHRLGAAAVRDLLGERVAALVEHHVDAKRYLVTVDPAYRATLSPGSIETLAAQGGDLSPQQVREVEQRPWWADAVALRRADDGAKVPGAAVDGLDRWVPALRAVAERAGSGR